MLLANLSVFCFFSVKNKLADRSKIILRLIFFPTVNLFGF